MLSSLSLTAKSTTFCDTESIPAMSTANATHVLIFPFPAQGHMLPILDLTNQLAIRGLKITILVTPKNLPILTPIISTHPSIQTLILPLPQHPKLPPGVENIRDIGDHGNRYLVAALRGLDGPITDWFKAHPSPPRVILSDFFLGWTQNMAQKLVVPRFAFFSSGSFVSSVLAVLFSDIDKFMALDPVEFTELPNSPVFKRDHLPSSFKFYIESDPDSRLAKNGVVANMSSWGCVFNSFRALEGDYLDHFKKQTVHGRVYGVGPINLFEGSGSLIRANSDQEDTHEVLNWLDNCPDDSVLYVSFGSQTWLTEPQLEALGLALEKSGTRFIWVVRSGPDSQREGPVFLDGFEKRVAGQGFIVKGWAPQVEILGHRTVSGFLSHCGFNSALEAVVAGVMILAWPMQADQYFNARILVEDMGVAVRVCEGLNTVPNGEELGRVIGEVMCSRDDSQKEKVKELKQKTLAAVKDGGSSAKDLDDFVNELVRIA